MNRFTALVAVFSVGAMTMTGLVGCKNGGYSGYTLPIETPLKEWQAPEADDLVEVEDTGDYEDYEDYEDEDSETTAPAAATTTAPAAAK